MGIYANHGIEYHIVYTSGERDVFVPMKNTDKRLLASKYFEKHKDTWLKPETMYNGPFIKIIDDLDFDVELTEEEHDCLEKRLKDKKNEIKSHGWYEVNTIENTY